VHPSSEVLKIFAGESAADGQWCQSGEDNGFEPDLKVSRGSTEVDDDLASPSRVGLGWPSRDHLQEEQECDVRRKLRQELNEPVCLRDIYDFRCQFHQHFFLYESSFKPKL